MRGVSNNSIYPTLLHGRQKSKQSSQTYPLRDEVPQNGKRINFEQEKRNASAYVHQLNSLNLISNMTRKHSANISCSYYYDFKLTMVFASFALRRQTMPEPL